MSDRILEDRIGHPDFTHFTGRKGIQHITADIHCCTIRRCFNDIAVILCHGITFFGEIVTSFTTYCVKLHICRIKTGTGNSLFNITVVAAGKAAIGRNDNNCLFLRFTLHQITMVNIA